MVKIIFCDLDDTLLHCDTKQIYDEDVIAIKRWLESGKIFVLATARHHSFLNTVSRKLSMYDFDCIGWNGAEIYIDREIKKLYSFSFDEICFLYEKMDKYNDYIRLTNIKNEYLFGKFVLQTYHLYEKYPYKFNHKDIVTYIQEQKVPIAHVTYIFPNIELRNQFYQECEENQLNKLYNCKITSENSVDITQILATKENGIWEYLRINKMLDYEFAVIGDSLNDLGMIEMTNYSFCMMNGHEKVKTKAYYVINKVSDAIEILECEVNK